MTDMYYQGSLYVPIAGKYPSIAKQECQSTSDVDNSRFGHCKCGFSDTEDLFVPVPGSTDYAVAKGAAYIGNEHGSCTVGSEAVCVPTAGESACVCVAGTNVPDRMQPDDLIGLDHGCGDAVGILCCP